MAVTLFPDGVPCALQEAFDLSFLRQWGKVFRVFDQQDSGNLCFGLEDETHRYFVKFAGARPVRYKGEPERAVELLKQSGRVYRDLAHPVLLPLLWEGPVEGGYALLFPWTEAICMGKQYPSRERFLALPLDTKLGIYREALAFHSHVAKRGYVSADFYDGCVLFEEATGRTLLCDVDAYHRLPFFNPVGRMWGSTRFMAPEEFEKGAAIDESTMVHTLGAFAFELFAPEGRELTQWPLSPAAWACAKKAASPKREDRFVDVASYIRAWEDAIGRCPLASKKRKSCLISAKKRPLPLATASFFMGCGGHHCPKADWAQAPAVRGVTSWPAFQVRAGYCSRKWRSAGGMALPPEVAKGTIALPEKSPLSRKVSTARGSIPHQMGKPTKTVSYCSTFSTAAARAGRQAVSRISKELRLCLLVQSRSAAV